MDSTAEFSKSTSSPAALGLAQELPDARAELASLEASAKRHREVLKLLAPFVFVAGQPTLQLGLRKVLQHGWNSVHWAQGYTLLHYVGEKGDDSRLAELVACLAGSAAEVDEPDEKGRRPLEYARLNPCEGVSAAFEKVRRQQRTWQDLASLSPVRRSQRCRGGADSPPRSRSGCSPAAASRGRGPSSCDGPLASPWGAVTSSSGPGRVGEDHSEGRARTPASAGSDPSLVTFGCAVPSGAPSAGAGVVGARSRTPGSTVSTGPCETDGTWSSACTSDTDFGSEEGSCREAARLEAPRSWPAARPRGDGRAEAQGGFVRTGLII